MRGAVTSVGQLLDLLADLESSDDPFTYGELLGICTWAKWLKVLPSDVARIVTSLKRGLVARRRSVRLVAAGAVLLLLRDQQIPPADVDVLLGSLVTVPEPRDARYAVLCVSNAEAVLAAVHRQGLLELSGQWWRVAMTVYKTIHDEQLFDHFVGAIIGHFSKQVYVGDAPILDLLAVALTFPIREDSAASVLCDVLQLTRPRSADRAAVEQVVAQTQKLAYLPYLLYALDEDNRAIGGNPEASRSIMKHRLLQSFRSTALVHVCDLYVSLAQCRETRQGDDAERQRLRQDIGSQALLVFQCCKQVLWGFIRLFGHHELGQRDVVYLLTCLPREQCVSFLEELIHARRQEPLIVLTATMALRYVTQIGGHDQEPED